MCNRPRELAIPTSLHAKSIEILNHLRPPMRIVIPEPVTNKGGMPSRTFTIQSPDGQVVTATGVKTFAKANGLDSSPLHLVINGKAHSHKGWVLPTLHNIHTRKMDGVDWQPMSIRRYSSNTPITATLRSPSGELVTFTSLSGFARKHGLATYPLRCVLRGKARHHKGWTLPTNP